MIHLVDSGTFAKDLRSLDLHTNKKYYANIRIGVGANKFLGVQRIFA